MDYTTLTIEAALLLIAVYACFAYWKYKDFPPGPYGIPLLGYSPLLGAKPHVKLTNLAKKYGNIFSVNLGSQQTVVVNDWQSIKEVLVKQGNAFSSRPLLYFFHIIFQGKENDILTTNGAVQKDLKRITTQILKSFGMGHSSLESVVVEEVEKLATYLKTQDGQLIDTNFVIFIPILNVIWGITAGIKFDIKDPRMRSFAQALHFVTCRNNAWILNIFPFLRFVAPELTDYKKLMDATKTVTDYVEQVVNEHYENKDGQQSDFIYAFIEEIKWRKNVNRDQPPYCKNNLLGAALDMFGAGVESTSTTLQWALLLMASYPDIQKKVQRELDERIDVDSHLPYTSRSTIPYTEATLNEVHRFATTGTLSVPHCASRDATLFGYKIPQGTTVLLNIWALNYDEKYWTDPEQFRPERFLDEEGRPMKHERHIPFGAGPRACLGEPLAKLELTLFFTCLMRRFSFELNPNDPKMSESPLEPIVGLALRPRHSLLVVKCR